MLSLSNISQTCVKCAKCVPSCTIYLINRDEVTSPRGFVDLLGIYEKKNISLDKNLKNIFESCFMCTTCTTLCPQTIDTARLIEQSRIDIAQKYGIAWYKKIYFFLLRHRKIMNFVFSFTSFVAPCAFKQNDDKLRSRFKLSKFGKRTIFPFSKKSFLQKYRGLISARDSNILDSKNPDSNILDSKNPRARRKKVAIFIGCLSNYNYTQIGESLLFILDKLGIDALIPPQECCGAPAYFTGDIKTVITLAKKNIALFEKNFNEIDAMLIPEATCAAMIMQDWRHALEYENNKEWIARLDSLLPKIHMASEYLYSHTHLSALLAPNKKDIAITYHDPCHAKKVLGISKEPRAFLGASYNLIEMEECDRCCGFGGVTIQSEKYHLAYEAGKHKAHAIAKSGAEIVSSECSACRMQINNALDNEGVQASFKHPLELIKDALIAQ